jgi:hypothetical protein
VLKQLALALDATSDYFIGLGDDFESYEAAAVQMSFVVFLRDISITPDQRERCRRVLGHTHAPRSVLAWRALAEMVDLAIGPMPPRIGIAKRR